MFEANLGERVEWIAIAPRQVFHTFHMHAHRWADNRTGMLEGPSDPSLVIDNKDLGPGELVRFPGDRRGGRRPGAWMYHCHVQTPLRHGGMAGIFLVAQRRRQHAAGR